MKPALLVGILLVILGVIGLAYHGITYTRHKEIAEIGPIHAEKTEHRTIPISPVLAGIALVGGIALIAVGSKSRA